MSKTIKYCDLAMSAQRCYQQFTNRGTELTVSLLGFTLFNCSELNGKMMLTADVNKLATQQQLATFFMSGTETEKEAVQTIVAYLDKLISSTDVSMMRVELTERDNEEFGTACQLCNIAQNDILNIIKERGLDGKIKTNNFNTRAYSELASLVNRDVTRTVLNKLLANPKNNQLIQAAQSIITYLQTCNNKNNSCEDMKAGLNTNELYNALRVLDIDWNDILYLYRPDDNNYYRQEVIKKDRNKNIKALQAVFTYITTNEHKEPIKNKQTDFDVTKLPESEQTIYINTTDITLHISLKALDRNRQARETYSMLLHDLQATHGVDDHRNIQLPQSLKSIPFFEAIAFQQPEGRIEDSAMENAKNYALEILKNAVMLDKASFLQFIANDRIAQRFCSNKSNELMIITIYQYIKEAAAQCVIKDNNESVEKWQAAEKNIKYQELKNTTDLQNKIISRMFADLQQYKDNGDDNINGVGSKHYSVNPNRVGRLEAREQITVTMRAFNRFGSTDYSRKFISKALACSADQFYTFCIEQGSATSRYYYYIKGSATSRYSYYIKDIFHEKVPPLPRDQKKDDYSDKAVINSRITSANSLPSRESAIAFWKMVRFYAQDGNPTIYNNSYLNTDNHTKHAQEYRGTQEAKKTKYLQRYTQLKENIKYFVAEMNQKDISSMDHKRITELKSQAGKIHLELAVRYHLQELAANYHFNDGKVAYRYSPYKKITRIELNLSKINYDQYSKTIPITSETFTITGKPQVQQSS